MTGRHPLKAYLQLVRLPNLFTAAADGLAGWLLAGGALAEVSRWGFLVAASVCVYAGGVVLNDVLDLGVDRVERPTRPLPSGRVGLRTAALLGSGLLLLGLAFAWAAATRHGAAVGLGLVGCVLAYDLGLKRTPLGPEVMGSCRALNLLLGMSRAEDLGGPAAWLVAGWYGTFVAGVTWVSRSEAETGRFKAAAAGLALEITAVLGLAAAATRVGRDPVGSDAGFGAYAYSGAALLLGLAVAVGRQTARALRRPEPATLQRAVKFAILSLVWLHVGVLLVARGPTPALAVALFWLPAAFSGRWIYST